jgi:hypothetical protein
MTAQPAGEPGAGVRGGLAGAHDRVDEVLRFDGHAGGLPARRQDYTSSL